MSDESIRESRELRDHLLTAAETAPDDTAEMLRRLADSPLLYAMAFELGGVGNCLRAAPPSALQLELDGKGLRYCCNHKPQHCSGYFA